MQASILGRLRLDRKWSREAAVAVIALVLGFGLLPLVIFHAGSLALGLYDGASVARLYDTVYRGLREGSVASWIVVFGPYGIYLTFKGLGLWWRAGSQTQ